MTSFGSSLFWDTDPSKLDLERHSKYIIERIMDYGADEDVRWMWNQYPVTMLANVARKSRNLRPETRAFWRLITEPI